MARTAKKLPARRNVRRELSKQAAGFMKEVLFASIAVLLINSFVMASFEVPTPSMEKTVMVMLNRLVLSPIYKKYIRKRTKVKAHDEKNECHIGDKVLLIETRPLSKEKRWRVKEILERAV